MRLDFNKYLNEVGEVGFVEKVVSSLVYTDGLPGARPQELVIFEDGGVGEVITLGSTVEILSFSRHAVRVGTKVVRTNEVLQIPVGQELLGQLVDPFGRSLDPLRPAMRPKESRPVDVPPSDINTRVRIKEPCDTGVAMVDFLVPLGKGQRELVIGDQKTGKTRFLLRALLAQVKAGSVGIYAVIGKSQMAVKEVEKFLEQNDIKDRVVIIASVAGDSSGIVYLTPYAATAVAEYFRDSGKDVLLILDDLSLHAKVYREIALLGRRYPGRNSYPGDIFYAHARLLERSGNFISPSGEERAITCIPVVEALQGDLSGYIQTNAMSVTDGHIFFDRVLFTQGRRPAVDPFLSVTRVGKQAQSPLKQEINRTLLIFLKEVEKLHTFTSFGAELGEHIKKQLRKEERILKFFDQTAYDYISPTLQLFIFGLVWGEWWTDKTPQEVQHDIQRIVYTYQAQPEVRRNIDLAVSGVESLSVLVDRVKIIDVLKI